MGEAGFRLGPERYAIAPGWWPRFQWALLRRVRFSRRLRLARWIGWPKVVVKHDRIEDVKEDR